MNDDYMISFQNETKQTIEASYKKMTAVERSVADFFIGNKDDMDFSSKNISRVLYVSEATLSRFSQKCGYKGYREFIFSYERDLKFEQKSEGTEKDVGLFARRVQNSYQKLLQENFRILDEEQVRRVAGMLNVSKRVLIFGIGNSGYAAEEFQLRFMRIGMDVNAVTDSHMMKIGAALAGGGNTCDCHYVKWGDGRSVRKYSDCQKQRCKYYMHDSSFRVIRCKGIAGSNSGSSIKKSGYRNKNFTAIFDFSNYGCFILLLFCK